MTDHINVIVHGLFFMRTGANNTLELIAPRLTPTAGSEPHKFLGGVRGDLEDLTLNPSVPTDWTRIGLIGKPQAQPQDVKQSILQFSIGKELVDWNPKNFGGIIVLPWPKDFYSLRCDYFDRAFLFQDSAVATSIRGKCRVDENSKIGLMTCLHYWYDKNAGVTIHQWNPGKNLHCYYEPCKKHNATEVNTDLNQASHIFTQYGNFSLVLKDDTNKVVTGRGERCPSQPPGINEDDDYTLAEDPEALKQGKCVPLTKDAIPFFNFNPANCPSFFVNP